jgi:2-octaprenylphenol hydroxylase
MNLDYDIAIIGGGMVGATLACALGGSRLRVAVVEPVAAPRQFPAGDFDIRVSAITRATQNVFAAIGAWDGMVARRVQPYEAMHVWDACGGGAIHFDCTELGEPDLGHIIENRVILAALLDRLASFGNIDFLCPASATGMQLGEDAAQLFLADGRIIAAKLLVGTDGTTSWVREQAGIDSTGWAYDQTAVVATVKTSQHHQNAAWQRFLPSGPLAFLPLPEGYSSIVWSTSHAQAEVLRTLPSAQFLDELQLAFGDALGRMESVGPRGAFPLRLQHADRYVLPRLALAGNAAHALHPLAGQGLNIGILDAAALVEVLLSAGRKDIGSLALLRRYERWRKGDNIAMVGAMDVFKRLFSNDTAPLVQLRNAGLAMADRLGPVKNFFVRRGMGLAGDLPRLARMPPP